MNMCKVYGHRGARGVYPENSLPGFLHAFDLGVDGIELDLNLTADSKLLIVHDETTSPDLVRSVDKYFVTERTPWRQLLRTDYIEFDIGRLRTGTEYANHFPEQIALDGTGLPEFSALMNEFGNVPTDFEFIIEIKHTPGSDIDVEEFSTLVIAEIHRLKIAQQVSIQSFNWEILRCIQALDSELRLGCLSEQWGVFDTINPGDGSNWTAGLRVADFDNSVPAMVVDLGADYWSPYYSNLTQSMVKETKFLGLDVITWTVNDVQWMKKLLSWQVDGIISDYPQLLLKTRQQSLTEKK
ncbi:MAG: glycerophosphoryl diester phosphodiesterase [Parasphingorhabdus sp.]